MRTVALCYQKARYARALAETLDQLNVGYQARVITNPSVSTLPYLVRERDDIVQTDELLRYGSIAALNRRFTGTPFVSHVQGWGDYLNAHGEHGLSKRLAIRLLTNFTLHHATAVLFVSRETRRMLSTQFDFPRWEYAKPVFDVEQYATRSGNEHDDNRLKILTVTNLRYQKKLDGIRTILEAIEPLFSEYDGLEYSIAGGGRYLEMLRSAVEQYSYADRVQVLGSRTDVPALLADADVFVYVSYLDSLGVVVLEAQAAGLPVIAGDVGGIPEAVGDAGIICSPTPAGVRMAVRTILDRPELRDALGAHAEEKMARYRVQQTLKHVALWDSILS